MTMNYKNLPFYINTVIIYSAVFNKNQAAKTVVFFI